MFPAILIQKDKRVVVVVEPYCFLENFLLSRSTLFRCWLRKSINCSMVDDPVPSSKMADSNLVKARVQF
jgi:hypothetical protein